MPKKVMTHLEMDLKGNEVVCTIDIHPDPNKEFDENGEFIIAVTDCSTACFDLFEGEKIFVRGAISAEEAGYNFLDEVRHSGILPHGAILNRTSIARYEKAA